MNDDMLMNDTFSDLFFMAQKRKVSNLSQSFRRMPDREGQRKG